MKFIGNKESEKGHLTIEYSTIVVDYGHGDVFFYKIEYEKNFIVEIDSHNDFRVFDFRCNWGTWEEFIDNVVLDGDPCKYTIIEKFADNDEFEINIERVI